VIVALISAAAFALLATFSATARAGDAVRAKRDLMMAKDNAESARWDDLDTNMKRVAADMEGLSASEKAPLLSGIAEIKATVTKSVEDDVNKRLDKAAKADGDGMAKLDIDRATMRLNSDEAKAYADPAVLDKLRARIAGMTGAPASVPKTPDTTTPPQNTPNTRTPMSGDVATAVSRLRTARGMIEQGDRRMAEGLIHDAVRLVQNASDAEKAPVLDDIAVLNKQIDEGDLKAQRDEEFRRIDEQVHRFVGTAENSIEDGVVCDSEWIDKSEDLLAGHAAQTYMDAGRIKDYQARLDAVRTKLKAHNKDVALDRAARPLRELEERVASDPFKGTDDISAYNVYSDINSLSDRVKAEFRRVPQDDPDIKAVLDRVAAANAKVEAASSKWAMDKMQERFASGWKFESQSFAGWESEQLEPNSVKQRRIEGLNKTTQAIRGTVYWLNEADTKQAIEKYKDNATVQATVRAAHKTLDEASAKLNEGFNLVVAEAEGQPMPARESDRSEMKYLAHDAATWFAGTKYKDANVARAEALDGKWKAEVARIEKEMEEWLKKATADADAAWPRIAMSLNAEKGFNPSEAAQWKGKTVEIKGYYNRSGWDFDGAYDFSCDIKGFPVGGNYAPDVLAAFNDASRHTRFGINDHIGWDVIAVVEGPGQIKRRITTEWKDKDTHTLLMKTESYVPEPCVVLRIIALRAGPVAVGPK
jgi:hypothetical protein